MTAKRCSLLLFLSALPHFYSVTAAPVLPFDCLNGVQAVYAGGDRVEVYQGSSVNVTLKFDPSAANLTGCDDGQVFFQVYLSTGLPTQASIEMDNHSVALSSGEQVSIRVNGLFVGYSFIWLAGNNASMESVFKEIKVATLRVLKPRDAIFQAIVFALIIFGNAGIGLSVDWKEIREVLKKPIGPAIGLSCQYLIMPLTAFGIVKLIQLEPRIAIGIFIVGCSPGGGGSNYHTYFLGGNLPLSVTMTILSTVTALGMMPLWIYTLGRLVVQDATGDNQIYIDFKGIGLSLASTVFPFGVGILVRWWRPPLADKLFRLGVRPSLVVIFAYLITAGLLTNLYAFRMLEPKILLAAILLPYTGFSLGFGAGYLFKQGFSKSITIAIETGIQSAGVAMATLMMSLQPPDSDIAIIGPITTTMLTPVPLWIAEICLAISICVKKGRCYIFDACRGQKVVEDCEDDAESPAVSVPLMSPEAASPDGSDKT